MIYSVMLDRADEMDLIGSPTDFDGSFREMLNENLLASPEQEDGVDYLMDWLRS